MSDQLDHRVHDFVALAEIDLYADVLSAVAAVDRPLTPAELDAVLGVRPAVEEAPAGSADLGVSRREHNVGLPVREAE